MFQLTWDIPAEGTAESQAHLEWKVPFPPHSPWGQLSEILFWENPSLLACLRSKCLYVRGDMPLWARDQLQMTEPWVLVLVQPLLSGAS